LVHVRYRGLKLTRRLYDARKQLLREKNLMRIVVGGRIPGYAAHAANHDAREYIDKVLSKSLFDPILTTQLSNGFVIKRLIPGYLSTDADSRGYAAFLEWANVDYVPDPKRRFVAASPVRVCAVQYQMRNGGRFRGVRRAVRVLRRRRLGIQVRFHSLSGDLHDADPVVRARRQSRGGGAPVVGVYASVSRTLHEPGGEIQRQHHWRLALHRRGRRPVQHRLSLPPDGTLGKQYKLHITPTERHWWGVKGGDRVEVFDTDRGKVAIQICYDIEFPELTRIAAERGAQIIFVPFCTDERYAYLRVRYCSQARCVENHVYVVIAGCVGNLPGIEGLDIHYAQSGVFTPSDIPFKRDAIAAECTPNIETVIFEDLDLELLKKHRQSGSVLNWQDRRTDLYEVRYLKNV